jgi:hypothetical protein
VCHVSATTQQHAAYKIRARCVASHHALAHLQRLLLRNRNQSTAAPIAATPTTTGLGDRSIEHAAKVPNRGPQASRRGPGNDEAKGPPWRLQRCMSATSPLAHKFCSFGECHPRDRCADTPQVRVTRDGLVCPGGGVLCAQGDVLKPSASEPVDA